MMTSQLVPNDRERVLAALANASVLISLFTGFGGAVAAAVIWAVEKDRSQYVAFQALQATAYQLLGALVFGLAWCCWMGFYFATWIPMIPQLEENPDALPPLFWIGMLSMVCPMLVMGAWALYGLWGALETYRGKDFRYAVIGNWIKRSMINSQETA